MIKLVFNRFPLIFKNSLHLKCDMSFCLFTHEKISEVIYHEFISAN